MANVIAASWNAGILPVATVSTASSDHIRIAVNPIRVAVRAVMAGAPPLPLGEGWGEGLRSIDNQDPLTRRYAVAEA
jgi:hypothetical protein